MSQRASLDTDTLASLLDGLADAVVVSDPDGVIVYWNNAAEKLFGWDANHALGQSLDLIIPEKQRKAHWDRCMPTVNGVRLPSLSPCSRIRTRT